MTVADHIRSMSDEELANFIIDLFMTKPVVKKKERKFLVNRWLEVLKDEYER